MRTPALNAEQLSLFPELGAPPTPARRAVKAPQLSAATSLATTTEVFRSHMARIGFSPNTVKAFYGDLRLLGKFLGMGRAVGKVGTKDLQEFLAYLRFGRGVSLSSKSYARRVTSLKVFFGWLTKEKILPGDPAAILIHEPVASPLPEALGKDEVKRLIQASKALLKKKRRPDSRPYLLITLLLHTGLKKSECLAIRLRDLDLSDPANPMLYVQYADPRKRKKERRLPLPHDFVAALGQYIREYSPKEYLFECTGRNLEYVLGDAARLASLERGVSFEALRMTCALRDYKAGMLPDELREKLGLSPVTWRERLEKIKMLASPTS